MKALSKRVEALKKAKADQTEITVIWFICEDKETGMVKVNDKEYTIAEWEERQRNTKVINFSDILKEGE